MSKSFASILAQMTHGQIHLLDDLADRCGKRPLGSGDLELYLSGPFENPEKAVEVVRWMIARKIPVKLPFLVQYAFPLEAAQLVFEALGPNVGKKAVNDLASLASAAGRVDLLDLLLSRGFTFTHSEQRLSLMIASFGSYSAPKFRSLRFLNARELLPPMNDSALLYLNSSLPNFKYMTTPFLLIRIGGCGGFSAEKVREGAKAEFSRLVASMALPASIHRHVALFQSVFDEDEEAQALLADYEDTLSF
jgi:hypothetical protein